MAFKLTKDEKAKLDELSSFVADVRDRLQGEFDERSEKWQEGDSGQEAQSMIEAWDGLSSELDDLPQEAS